MGEGGKTTRGEKKRTGGTEGTLQGGGNGVPLGGVGECTLWKKKKNIKNECHLNSNGGGETP